MPIIIFLFITGFIFLIKGADYLVEGGSSLAQRLKISDLVIGLTLVAFGTSGPELFVNIVASIKGTTGIAIGNVLGSNIANIFLVLGVSSVIFPLVVTKDTVYKQIPFMIFAVLILGIMANYNSIIRTVPTGLTRIDGVIFLGLFVGFIFYSLRISPDVGDLGKKVSRKEYSLFKSFFLIILGLLGLSFGARLIVNNALILAKKIGASESLIGLTVVALGTSLPELATSVVAALRKNPNLAVGNVVGSNIFNIFLVLGTSSLIRPMPFHKDNNLDLVVTIVASLLFFLCMFTGKKKILDRWEGVIFLILYVSYIGLRIVLR